jgi:hypothetical protein
MDHLNENVAAVDVQLTPADLNELDAEFSKVKVPWSPVDDGHVPYVMALTGGRRQVVQPCCRGTTWRIGHT